MLSDDLLELQRIDTATDQLRHRAESLPERAAAADARHEAGALQRRRSELADRRDELESAIATAEDEGAALSSQRTRLEGQLRTVVAPREAEALMHEIESIGRRRNEVDDRELQHLDEQGAVEAELDVLANAEPSLLAAATTSEAMLHDAEAVVDRELADLAVQRDEVVRRIDPGTIERYARMRDRQRGVAVARLVGTRCDGCHLDLSTAELDTVRHTPPGELAECPQCGRLLVPG